MIQLDETGAQYVQLPPHPYFTQSEPQWEKPYYPTGNIATNISKEDVNTQNTYIDENVEKNSKLWPFLRL